MYPIAKKETHEYEIHGRKILDEYAWLRAKEWPEQVTDPAVIGYLNEENTYFDSYMKPLESKKQAMFEELKGRIKLDDQSPYRRRDSYLYYDRTEADKEYKIYCRKKLQGDETPGEEEILLDVNQLAEGKPFCSVDDFVVSPDHSMFAFSVDFSGQEIYTIQVYDIEKKTYLSDKVERSNGLIEWHETIDGFFYTPLDENLRSRQVYFHTLGQETNQLIYDEPDTLYSVYLSKSSSRSYLIIQIQGLDNNELRVVSLRDKDLKPVLLREREDGIVNDVAHNGTFFYLHTNKGLEGGKVKNFHLLRAPVDAHDQWQICIPTDEQCHLDEFHITKSYLILAYKQNGLYKYIIKSIEDWSQKEIKFEDPAYSAFICTRNYYIDDIRIDYSSPSRPNTVYSYDFKTDALTVLKVTEIPSGLNSNEYTVERLYVESSDETKVKIPVSLVYKKTLFKKDGTNPLYLYGYGSYGYAKQASFSNAAISLVNRGFVYAIAHIRGGGDLGREEWYETAKFLHKKRTFHDFIDVTEHLIKSGYTSKGNVVMSGASAGGLLIGYVLNERPDLYKAAVADVPFVDVINTMLDESLPLTPGEFKEWGNPKDKEFFDYMITYSPYDNVKRQNYPAILVQSGLSDSRVTYWEPAKWVAKLRDYKTDSNILLLKTNMDSGHGGASGRFDYLKEVADELVFILSVFKIDN